MRCTLKKTHLKLVAGIILATSLFTLAIAEPTAPTVNPAEVIPQTPTTQPIPTYPPISEPTTAIPSPIPPTVDEKNLPESTTQAPNYEFTENIHSYADNRLEKLPEGRPPYLEAIRTKNYKIYSSNRAYCQKREQQNEHENAKG